MVKYPHISALTVHGHFIYEGTSEKFKVQHFIQVQQILDGVRKVGPREMAVFIDDRNLTPNFKKNRLMVDRLLLELIEVYIQSPNYEKLEIFIRAPGITPTKGVVRNDRSRGAFAQFMQAVPGHEYFYSRAGKLGIVGGLIVGGKPVIGVSSKVFSPNDDVVTPLDFNNIFPMKSVRAELVEATGTVFDDPNAPKDIESVRYIVHSKDGFEWVFDKPYVSVSLDHVNGIIDQIPLSKVTVASVPKASMGPTTVMMALPFGIVPEGALFQQMLDGIQL